MGPPARVAVIKKTEKIAKVLERIWRNWKPHALLLGIENRKQVGGYSKVKHSITMGPRNSTPMCIPPKFESRDSNKYVCIVLP